MKILVGGETRHYEDGLTVSELIKAEKVETPEYVTVTLNDEFLKKEDFETTVIKEGDIVEFLYFMGGGDS